MDKDTWFKKIGLALILILIVFLFLINTRKVYETETDILVLPKNPTTGSAESIIENFKQIVDSYTFYQKISDSTGGIMEIDEGMPRNQQKAIWDSKIEIKKLNNSNVFSLKTFDKSQEQAEDLNQESIKNLVLTIGQYYDINSDLELRIIDGPITVRTMNMSFLVLLSWSILSGIVLYLLIFEFIPWFYIKKEIEEETEKVSTFFDKKFSKQKPEQDIYKIEEYYFPQEIVQKKEKPVEEETSVEEPAQEISEEKREEKQSELEKKTEITTFSPEPTAGKKAATPDNLPTSDEIPAFLLTNKPAPRKSSEEKKEEKKEELDHSREATPEEVKERLNKLLRG